MQPRMRAFLEESGLDGLLMVGESICNADMFYLSRFLAQDSFTLLLGEHVTLLVSSMEVGRALKESSADEVVSTSRYGIMERLLSGASPGEAYHQVLVEFLRDQGMRRIGVPFRFPAGAYQRLSRDFPVTVLEESPVARWRSVKTAQEMDAIRQVQRACERAIGRAVELIAAARVRGDLLISGDSPLTAEQVRTCIEACLLEDGCESADTIVAGGDAAVDPHARGSGPLPAGSPIVIDVSPRSKTSRYYADMTRTVLRGEASPEVREMYEAVRRAQEVGLSALRAGARGRDVHYAVSEALLELGYPEREGRGFTHSTGHGVGLEVHELPSLGISGGLLEAGNVVTVEPGLYYPGIGGVRLEDLAIVGQAGCENITSFERRLVL